MIKLELKALTKKSSIKLIVLAIIITITAPILFLFTLIYFDKLPDDVFKVRMIILSFSFALGILFIFGIRIVLPSKKYTLIFDAENITIKSDKEQIINYNSIKSITIKNNTDYSNIHIKQTDNQELKLYVGFANLINNKSILKSENQLDNQLLKYFSKEIFTQKGITTITFNSLKNLNL